MKFFNRGRSQWAQGQQPPAVGQTIIASAGPAAQAAGAAFVTFIGSWRTRNRGAAVILWIVGAWATTVFMKELGLERPWDIICGVGAQYLLTVLERPLWRFGQKSPLAIVAIVVDVIFNAGGLWSYLSKLGQTQTWQMLAEVSGSDPEPIALVRFVIAVGLGLVTAAGSDVLWNT